MFGRNKKESLFLKLVEQNKGVIYALCKSYHSIDADRQDSFQEIIAQLWIAFPSFRSESKFSTWMYKIALHTLLNQKRKKRIQTGPLDQAIHISIDAPSKEKDTKEVIEILFDQLEDLDRGILILYLEGYANKEIAKILDMPYTNVTTRMYRIKQSLSKKVKNGLIQF